jgi:hypothetical protein
MADKDDANLDEAHIAKHRARAQAVFNELIQGCGSIVAREKRLEKMTPVERFTFDSLQNERAKAVIEGVLNFDDPSLEDHEVEVLKLNQVIADNLDADSIWAFAFIARSTLRKSIFDPLQEVEVNLQAREYALKRHGPASLAKEFVLSEWAKNRAHYKGNKSSFARDYSRRILNEFVDAKGDPLDIKEKTIREVWLSNTPSASKPAG